MYNQGVIKMGLIVIEDKGSFKAGCKVSEFEAFYFDLKVKAA